MILAALLVAVIAGWADDDIRVDLGEGLQGAWLRPAARFDGRAVLMLHGLADDMNGPGDLTKRLAHALASNGVATLRLNFRGEGDRHRTNIESTLTSRLADTARAHEFLRRQTGVSAGRIGAFGSSLGASTAIEAASRHTNWFRSLALWSSPSGDQFAALAATDTGRQALRDGVGVQVVPGWKTYTLRRDFYESFRGIDLDVSITRVTSAVLLVRGSLDFLPQRDAELLSRVPGRPAEAVLIGGADHIFNCFEPGLGHAERAVDVTVRWFERTL
jgi:uncharacterized protein